jgi:hypothetical protein
MSHSPLKYKETYLKGVGDHACMAPTADSIRDPTP